MDRIPCVFGEIRVTDESCETAVFLGIIQQLELTRIVRKTSKNLDRKSWSSDENFLIKKNESQFPR